MNTSAKNSGFTLLELVVAISLFSIFTAMILSLFTRFISTEKREIAQQALQDDMYYALETFNREARTAYGTSYVTQDGSQLFFHNQNGDCVEYVFADGSIKRGQTSGGAANCADAPFNSSGLVPLTSAETVISKKDSRFDPVAAQEQGDQLTGQGFVTIIISATSRRSDLPPLKLQSSITSEQVIPYVAS
jgi:prepilin-type N-terminal cleavage/methylation domain-containing protein